MKIDIITVFPDLFQNVFDFGIIGQGKRSKLLDIQIHDLRNWSNNSYKQVDDRPFGGGAGMVLMPEPLAEAIESIKADAGKYGIVKSTVIYLTPQGETLKQELAENISKFEHLILLCGRYEGIDQRIRDNFVDMEISIGNYVLSGGEIPAMALVDAVSRLIPGVIKNDTFNDSESFSTPEDRTLLDYTHYTRPEDFRGMKVPEVLLSGNHKKIEEWRKAEQKRC